jgi:hypothetical protein
MIRGQDPIPTKKETPDESIEAEQYTYTRKVKKSENVERGILDKWQNFQFVRSLW